MRSGLQAAGVLAAIASVWAGAVVIPGQTKAMPVPPGFDFPAGEQALLKMRDSNDVAGMRRHAWMVFAGMTQPTASGEAIWETWFSAEETFNPAAPEGVRRTPQRNFRKPRQFEAHGPGLEAAGLSLASFTLFNAEARTFIRANGLNLKTKLKQINDKFTPQTPVADRKVPDFPANAIALKTVWWIVKKQGMTSMPIWDPDKNPAIPGGNPPTGANGWKRCVAVDATRVTVPPAETTTIACAGAGGPTAGVRVVPLASFYNFPLSQAELDAMRNPGAVDIPNLSTATAGDFVALIGLHYTTKEIPDWVWATFWWHDSPDAGPFAANRPSEVKGVWRNYLMAEAYSMDTPPTDNKPHVAFNPWLEAPFPNGLVSNCMTCHRRAVFSGTPSDSAFLPVTRGTPPANDPRFLKSTKTDFLWSVVIESR